jgi:arylsulfatase A-like enzyme/Flp pilus assembly protein TadD
LNNFFGSSECAAWAQFLAGRPQIGKFCSVLLAAGWLTIGCGDHPAAVPATPRPDVVLVTIDTLRADRVGAYGASTGATPNLDRLARRGVIFEDATAHAPLTVPSHTSILTGLYPFEHKVRDNAGFSLPASSRTLAETLHGSGYRTAAFVASYVLGRTTGLARGFDIYADRFDTTASHLSLSSLQRRGPEVARDAATWLATAQHPFFLWVHFYDPHAPYDPPPAFAARFPGHPYEGEVATSDWALGELLRAIDKASANAVVIVTADHGESLGEHGEPEHGIFLYDATLRVPLVMSGPGMRRGYRVTQQVRHVDIAPTVLDLAHVSPSDRMDGMSLKALLEGRAREVVPASYSESAFGHLHFGWSELRAIRDGSWKYVEAPRPELYDMHGDPAERSNLLEKKRQTAAALAKALAALTPAASRGARDATHPQFDAVQADRLRTLGYMSGRVELGPETAGSDPKEHIAEYAAYVSQFTEGLDALQAGRQREAEHTFERLARSFPTSFEVREYLGRALAARGAHKEALVCFEDARRLSPRTAVIDFDTARSLAARRQFNEALAQVEHGLALEPDAFYGYITKGQVLRDAGQRGPAVAAFQKALSLSPGLVVAEYELGALAEQEGDRVEALSHYRRALSGDPGMTEAREAVMRLEGTR